MTSIFIITFIFQFYKINTEALTNSLFKIFILIYVLHLSINLSKFLIHFLVTIKFIFIIFASIKFKFWTSFLARFFPKLNSEHNSFEFQFCLSSFFRVDTAQKCSHSSSVVVFIVCLLLMKFGSNTAMRRRMPRPLSWSHLNSVCWSGNFSSAACLVFSIPLFYILI